MAITTTIFTPAITLFPWNGGAGGPVDVEPMAELIAVVKDGAVPVDAAGNSKIVRADVILPDNFTYVLTDAAVSMLTVTLPAGNKWDDLGSGLYLDVSTGSGPQAIEWASAWQSVGAAQQDGNSIKAFHQVGAKPTFQMKGGGVWQNRFTNPTVDDVLAQFNLVMRFLVYSITQQYDTTINTPLLTR